MGYSFDDYLKSKEEDEKDTTDEKDSGKWVGRLSFDEYIAQRNAETITEKGTSASRVNVPQTLKQRQQKNREQLLLGNGVGSSAQNRAESYRAPQTLAQYQQEQRKNNLVRDAVLKEYGKRSNAVGTEGGSSTGAFFGAGFEGKDKTQQQQAISDTLYLIEGYYTPRVTEKKANPLEGEKQSFGLPELTDWEQRARDPEEAQGLWDELQQQLAYVMYSGTYTEREAQSIADRVYKIVGDYQDKVDDEQMQEAMQWSFGESSEDFMKEWRYQNDYSKYSTDYQPNRKETTRESVPYRTTEELLRFVSSGGIFEYDSKRGVYTETPDNDKMAAGLYLANKPVTAEEYDRIINRFNMLAQNGKLPQETAAEWIAIRRENGLLGNTDGINAALTYVGTRGAGEVAIEGIDTGMVLAEQQIFGVPLEAMDQWITRGSGYLNEGVGALLSMMGFKDAGETLASKGREEQDYTSRNLVEAEQFMYNEQREYNEALSGVQNKVVRWLEAFIPGLTASAIGMGASAAVGGSLQMGTMGFTGSIGNTAKISSRALNATQFSAAYRAMGYSVKNARLLAMAGNAALNTYGSISNDERLNEAEKTMYALADGAAEFFSEKLFDGNPLLDGEDAGLFTKWVYSLTDDGSFRSISSTWLDLMKNRAFGAMAQKALTSKAMDLLGEGLEEVISSVGMMAVDYAMYGKTDVTWESLANDFASGVMLSMILSGGNELVQRLGPVNSAGDYKKIKFFTEDQQADIEAASKQMAIYVIDYLGGSQKLMQENGFSESQAEKAAGDFQRILQEYDQIKRMDQARQQVGGYQRQSTAAPEGREQTVGAAGETDISAEEVQARVDQAEGRLGDMDAYSLSYEAAVENAEEVAALWQEEHGKAAQEKNREMLIDAAANAVKLAAAAQINLDNALALTRITQEEHESASGKLQQVTDSAKAAIENYKNGVWPELEARTQGTTGSETVPAAYANGTQFNQTRQAYAPVMENGTVRGQEGEYQNGTETGTQSVRRDGGRSDALDPGEQAGSVGESGPQRASDTEGTGILAENERKSIRKRRLNRQIERFDEITAYKNASEVFGSEKYEGSIAEIPEELYTEEMKEAAEKIKAGGVRVRFFKGALMSETADGRLRRTPGLCIKGTNEVWASVSSARFTPEQLAMHEYFHALVNMGQANVKQIVEEIRNNFSPEEFERIAQQYILDYRGAYEGDDMELIYEEVLADAYAGMNRFATVKSAVQYQDTVRNQTQRGTDENKRATRDTRGAPGEKYSIERFENGEAYVKADRQVIFGNDPESWSKQLEDYINGKIRRGENVNLIAEDGDVLTLTARTAGKVSSMYDNRGRTLDEATYERKVNAGAHIDELAKVSKRGKYITKDINGRHGKDAEGGWNYRTAFFMDFDKKYYKVKLSVQIGEDGNAIYNIGDMQERRPPMPNGSSANGSAHAGESSFKESIAQQKPPVKQKFSFDDEDNNGRQLSDGQKAYFKNSVVRDDKGRLLTVYHGTDADFTVFDIMRAGKNGRAEGYGFYFSDDQEITGKYGDKQMEVYLNITKPLYSDRRTLTKAELRKFTDAVISREMKSDDIEWKDSFISNYIDTYSGISRSAAVQRFVNQIWEANENDQDLVYEIANGSGQNYSVETMKDFYQTLTESIGVDGNISTWTHADGESKVYVAFSPEQAKRVDNQEPTRNPDIRFSFDDEDYLLAVEAGDMDAAQEMVDEAANKAGFTYRRNSRNVLDPVNGTPWTMYADGKKYDFESLATYGENKYAATDRGAIFIDDIMDDVRKLAEDFYGEPVSDEEIDPPDVVMTEGVWDDMEFVQYAWDEYFERMFLKNDIIPAIKLQSGLFFFGTDEERIKSLAPVTYDDNGRIIPLSERFNQEKTDIRYSFEEDVAELDEAYRQEMDSEPMPHRTAEDLKREIQNTLTQGNAREQEPTATVTLQVPESDFYHGGTNVTHTYGRGKPFYSKTTTLDPKEALFYLQAATGMKWRVEPMRKGLWKAVMTTEKLDTVFSPPGYAKAVKAIKAADKNAEVPTVKEFAEKKLAEGWRDPNAPTAATVHADGIRKSDFTGSKALEKIGVKIDGSVTDYSITQNMRSAEEARRNIVKQIKRTERYWDATKAEKQVAVDIANGDLSYFDIPGSCRFQVVSELAALRMDERMAGNNLVQQRRYAIRDSLLEKAMDMFPNAEKIEKDPSLFHPSALLTMNYRTPQRNMLKIFGDELGSELYNYYFAPVTRNEASRQRWMNEQFDKVRKFKGSDGKERKLTKAESAYVHELLDLEGYIQKVNESDKKKEIIQAAKELEDPQKAEEDTILDLAVKYDLDKEQTRWMVKYAQWSAMQEGYGTKVDVERCKAAAAVYRQLFDDYFDAINDFLVAHGANPIGKIEGYTPHITANDKVNLLSNALEQLGFNANATRLPAEIAGRTEEFRPSKRWTPFFEHRTGDKTDYDIVRGFESYVTYISDVLFHMDDIQKIRSAEEYLRQGVSGTFETSIQEAIDMSRSGNMEDKIDYLIKLGRIREAEYGDYSKAEINEAYDALIKEMIGEVKENTRYSDMVVWLQNYANVLAGKQFGGDRGTEHMGGRNFLTFGNKINAVFARANVAGNLSSALNQMAQLPALISERRATSIIQALGEFTTGKLREFAMESDFLTAKKGVNYIVRSVGEMTLEGLFKPTEFMDSMLSTLVVRSAYLDAVKNGMEHDAAMRYADNYGQKIMADRSKGAKPLAFHSKGMVKQMLNMFQIEALNSWEHILQDLPRDFRQIARDGGKAKAARALALTILKYLLAAFVLNRWTEEEYGGTPAPFDLFGMTANFIASGNGLTANQWIKRTINKVTGVDLFEESNYEEFDEFDWGAAVEDTTWNLSNEIPFVSNVSGMLGLGDRTLPTALPGIVDAVEGIYDAANENGVFSDDTALALVELLKSAVPGGRQISKTVGGIRAVLEGGKMNGTGENERLQYVTDDSVLGVLQQVLFGVNATEESRAHYASGESGLTARQTQMWKEITEQGGDGKELFELINSNRKIENDDSMTSAERKEQQRNAIAESSFTDEQKAYIYSVTFGDKDGTAQDEPFAALMDAGMSWDDITKMFNEHKRIYNLEEISASEQTTEFQFWLDQQNYTKKQREIINEAFRYWTNSSVDPDESNYNKLVAQGTSPEEAKRIVESTVASDGESVKMKDKIDAILAQNMSDDKTYTALGAVLNEGVYDKLTEARAAGISCRTFLNFREEAGKLEADVDPNDPEKKIPGSKKEKVVELIDGLQLTAEQKDVLYLMYYAESGLYDTPWH